jgi:hypothetical protein
LPAKAPGRAPSSVGEQLEPLTGQSLTKHLIIPATKTITRTLPLPFEKPLHKPGQKPRILPLVVTQPQPGTQAGSQTSTQTATQTQTQTVPETKPATELQQAVETKTGLQTATQTQTQPGTVGKEETITETETIIETPTKVTEQERNRRHHEPTSEDKDKRALIRNAHSAVTYKRGELRGKGVWHTWLKKTKDSDWERAVVLGAKPEGAFYATGPGSATKTMQRLSGGSRININEDTGAVDTVLHGGEGEKVQIRFVPDKSIKREWRLKERQHSTYIRKARKAKEVYLGAGVVQEGLSGRRHIKIKGVRRL